MKKLKELRDFLVFIGWKILSIIILLIASIATVVLSFFFDNATFFIIGFAAIVFIMTISHIAVELEKD